MKRYRFIFRYNCDIQVERRNTSKRDWCSVCCNQAVDGENAPLIFKNCNSDAHHIEMVYHRRGINILYGTAARFKWINSN